MDLKAAIEHVQNTAGSGKTPVILHDQKLPPHQYYLCTFNGGVVQTTLMSADPKPRAYVATDLDGIVAQVEMLHKLPEFAGKACIMVGDGGIIVYFDEQTRRECCRMPLTPSPAMLCIAGNDELIEAAQADLVWTLRSKFRNAVQPSSFLPCVRSLKFKRSADGSSEVSHGRESMGKQVLAEVSGMTEIPEEITLGCAVYENVPTLTRCEVVCAVNVHIESSEITLQPVEGELRRVKSEAQQKIADFLKNLIGDKATILPCSGIA